MKKEVKVGLVGIITVIILFFGINYLKGIHLFKPSVYYYVEFEDINGLSTSSPVFANGFKIGIVRHISYDYKKLGHVIVEVEVDDDMRVPKGSTGELITEMLGTVKMNMKLNMETSDMYEPGDTIPGFANYGIMGVAATMAPKLDQMLPKLDSILNSLNHILANPALQGTINNAEKLTANLEQTTNHLNRFMSKDLPKLSENLTTITNNFSEISTNLKGINYAGTIDQINQTLAQVHQLTSKLNSKDNTIGLLLNDPSLYNNLDRTTSNAAILLQDLKEHPKRYVHFSLFGRKDKSEKK